MVTIVATDNEGAKSEAYAQTVRVGPEPPPMAPELSDISAETSGQCASVMGTVIDENQNLDSLVVAFANDSVTASVTGTAFRAEQCNLTGGEQTALVTATDLTGLKATASVTFTVDAGVTATLDDHIVAGRLDYTNYANCYLEYSTAPFRLDEYPISSDRCQWRDGDGSCSGPAVACSNNDSNSGGNDGSNSSCSDYSTYNYYHKAAGRAYSTGNPLTPDYFAKGSGDAMPGSTWGWTTLHSSDGSIWRTGNCP
ncbi:hypothetical protein SAMN05660479_02187 [Microbulbifer thermotolerans]|uniref:hypothetical protein n=1 Tax=Microbulbifer thermotolerans TaxID=252514 RepID=UPI0008E782D7|nr:hypothetical protein [Microbulbifer thermotolerans]SFC69284.1 hypothetical protein SAMN05660479_02187 [Microbulbifer thermotolerans]